MACALGAMLAFGDASPARANDGTPADAGMMPTLATSLAAPADAAGMAPALDPGAWPTPASVRPVAEGSAPIRADAPVALPVGLPALADLVLNAVRARLADCEGSPAQVAAAASGAGLLAVDRPRLNWNLRLADAALRHADAMARTRLFDHVGADGSTVRERVDATGYRWQLVGENLAAGQSRLEEAIVDWLNSPSHCAALLDARYTEFGLARIDSDNPSDAYGTYWTLVLGRPR